MHKRLVYVVTLSIILCAIPLLVNLKLPATGAQIKGLRRLDFDRKTGNLTLLAEDASLLAILQQLRERNRIEVVVPNLADRPVTANIVDTPLPQALTRLLPYGSRFHFIVNDGELKLPGNTGEKKPGIVERKVNLPKKDETRARPGPGPVKLAPDQVKPRETTGERGTKPAYQASLHSSEDPKKARQPAPERGRYARLNLLIKKNGTVQIIRFLEVEGTLVESTTVNGEFIYAAFVGGQLAAVGSIQDPLGIRSYLKDYGHSEDQTDSGTFVISLPQRFLDRGALSQTVIRFFYLSEAAPRTMPLTPQTFSKFRVYLKPVGEIKGPALVQAFAERLGRRTAR